ncbi:hypothetical protein CDAR_97311 [Caerostris darwini]|uniref:Uncharacterized protein n=1 Tax=Caerostris darwini TaxID=1538125 RepID=A0AAV4PV63_9ARAC|nr:hypothetical protein CDAR_97311 [Caerostris darwini]
MSPTNINQYKCLISIARIGCNNDKVAMELVVRFKDGNGLIDYFIFLFDDDNDRYDGHVDYDDVRDSHDDDDRDAYDDDNGAFLLTDHRVLQRCNHKQLLG